MKKALILIIVLSWPAYAGGQKYAHNKLSPFLDDEISNLYKQIGQVANGTYKASSMTLQGLTVDSITVNSNQTGISLGKIKQIVTAQSFVALNTTSASYANTSLAGTITPTSTASSILLLVSGSLGASAAAVRCKISVFRGASDVDNSGQGAAYFLGNATFATENPISFLITDTPASTSALTYTVAIKSDGVNTCKWNANAATTSLWILEQR